MTWLGVLFAAVGLADLLRGLGLAHRWAAAAGVLSAVVLLPAAGRWGWGDAAAGVFIGVIVVLWIRLTRRAGSARPHAAGRALAVLGVGAVGLLAFSGFSVKPGESVLEDWLRSIDVGGVRFLEAGHVVLLLGVLLANLATGNLVVRLVLVSTGALRPADVNPALTSAGSGPAAELRGGRLLGPMERLLIVGLGLAGQLTAAGLVIAAKGLIRFPELQAKRSDTEEVQGAGIDQVTEYFLVGSFVSWLFALTSLVCLGLVNPDQGW